ncbi:hypothetical protein D3C85_1752370 [compost metagenome]
MTRGSVQDISISLSLWQKQNLAILEAQDQAAKQCGVKLLDPTPYLCSAGMCWGSENLKPLYMDDNHLSETGNKKLVPMFKLMFEH